MPRGLGKPQKPPRGGRSSAEGREARGWGAGGSHPPVMPPSRGGWLEAGVAPAVRGIPTISYGAAGLGCPCGHGCCGAGSWGPPLCAGHGDAPQCSPSSLGACNGVSAGPPGNKSSPRALNHAVGLLGHRQGEIGVKGQKAGLGQAARDIPKASPAAQPRGPDPSGQGPQQGVGDSGRSRPTQRPSWFLRRKRGY